MPSLSWITAKSGFQVPVHTVYTIQTTSHCLNSGMYAYIYIVRKGLLQNERKVGVDGWTGVDWIPLRLL